MDERSYENLLDKSAWNRGPWDDEPDKIVWVDDATGLDCMIVRNRVGTLCGYVAVTEGHPWHGHDYDDVEPWPEVHGGLTYAAPCQPGKLESELAICHNAAGRPDNVWWLGFDCAHLGDLTPSYGPVIRETETYKPVAYVKAEVRGLAEQAHKRTVQP